MSISGLEFLEVSLEAICLIDLEGFFRSVNPAMEATLGYPRGGLVGLHFHQILHPDEVERADQRFRHILQSGQLLDDVTRCLSKDGSTRWLQWRAQRLSSEPLVLATARDVTQTRPESVLTESRPRAGGFSLTLSDRRLFWTRDCYALFETSPGQISPTLSAMVGFCLPDERDRIATAFERACSQGTPFELDAQVLTRKGRQIWLRLAAEVDGDHLQGTVEDVTQRRHELEGLQQYQWLLKRAQELAAVGAWWSDPSDSGRLVWSRGCYAIFGYTPDTFDGRVETFFALVHPEDLEAVRSASQAALQGGTPYNVIHRIIRPDGEQRWVHQKAEVLRDSSGAAQQMVGLCQDITRRVQSEEESRQLQAQVLQAQKLESLGLLAGGIAHDFNNLLMAIIGNAGLARLELAAEHPVSQMLQNIETASEQAAELCRQMLAYSGRARFVLGPVDLSELVREMSQLLKIGLSKKVSLKLKLTEELPPVEAEASQLRQVVMNLITNASEAIGDREGSIELVTRLERLTEPLTVRHSILTPGEYVVLEVRDSGAGMDRETLQKIFDPFFTTKFTGRGLGLAGVAGIVRGHQGGLEVLSQSGEGTIFRLYFPARARSERPRPPEPPREFLAGQGRVLVVDDEEQIRRLACNILERAGFEVTSASDGLEALARADQPGLSLVLLDLAMPRLDGQETLARLREKGVSVPVILTSGHMSDDQLPAEWEPVYRLAKPYRPDELVREVLQALAAAVERSSVL